MKEFKYYHDNGIPLANPPPEGFNFIGGKSDDITVTLAQVFADAGPDDPRRSLAAEDPFFKEEKFLYTRYVPSNKKDGFIRARFNDRTQP